jgi:hypothetical protein
MYIYFKGRVYGRKGMEYYFISYWIESLSSYGQQIHQYQLSEQQIIGHNTKFDIIVSMNNPGPTLGRALNVVWLNWWICFQPPLLIIWSRWLYISNFLAHCNTDYWPFNKLLVEINWTANKWGVKSHNTTYTVHLPCYVQGPSWSWSYGSWISNYLCNQCLSSLNLWFRTPFMAKCTRYNIMW